MSSNKRNLFVLAGFLIITGLLAVVWVRKNVRPIDSGAVDFEYKLEPKLPETNMKLTSIAFENNDNIPTRYTCDGEDINPPLEVTEVPTATKGLALIVDDPDAPVGDWVHWLVWNIDPAVSKVEEGSIPEGGVEGINDFKRTFYGGPCPPSGTHRYQFKLYALDTTLDQLQFQKRRPGKGYGRSHFRAGNARRFV